MLPKRVIYWSMYNGETFWNNNNFTNSKLIFVLYVTNSSTVPKVSGAHWRLISAECPPGWLLQACPTSQSHVHSLCHDTAQATYHTSKGLFDPKCILAILKFQIGYMKLNECSSGWGWMRYPGYQYIILKTIEAQSSRMINQFGAPNFALKVLVASWTMLVQRFTQVKS